MNLRERFTKKHTEFPIEKEKRTRWTDEDKEKLLSALKKYGYKDIDKICKDVPNKTKGAVRTFISKLNKEARASSYLRERHVAHWVHTGSIQAPDTVVSQALKFISLFEEHPQPDECAGCDFRALYAVLSKVTLGHPPVDISRMTHETISYVMAKVIHEVWPYHQPEITEYIENMEQKKTRKTYSRRSPRVVVPKVESDHLP
ncbi:uncharacterized protein LOC107046854 [Diachasma alloeum]|uniref:uncharacterized protein LOC107046854 n=1 Tax=Diachasma alloeum TaxID=454923 RepID=UPI00073843F4|nr:uncharacterized protein LOC107046854 [Diachasma alloeum]